MTHALCLIIAVIALGYAIYRRWRNEAEQMLADRDTFFND
jgi:hypothetical protein